MEDNATRLLTKLLQIYSPHGNEEDISIFLAKEMESLGFQLRPVHLMPPYSTLPLPSRSPGDWTRPVSRRKSPSSQPMGPAIGAYLWLLSTFASRTPSCAGTRATVAPPFAQSVCYIAARLGPARGVVAAG